MNRHKSPWENPGHIPSLAHSSGTNPVPAFTRPEEALLGVLPGEPIPPRLLEKLTASRHARDFSAEQGTQVKSSLGYYRDLQSLNSEDSVTWAVFGTLLLCEADVAAEWFRSFLSLLCGGTIRRGRSTAWLVPWQRLPHPQTYGRGGPEIDFYFAADGSVVCLLESKWRSDMDEKQGKDKTLSQLEIRLKSIQQLKRLGKSEDHIILFVTLPPLEAHYPILEEWFARTPAGTFTPMPKTNQMAQKYGATVLWTSWVDVLGFLRENRHPFGEAVPNYLSFRLQDYRKRYANEGHTLDQR